MELLVAASLILSTTSVIIALAVLALNIIELRRATQDHRAIQMGLQEFRKAVAEDRKAVQEGLKAIQGGLMEIQKSIAGNHKAIMKGLEEVAKALGRGE